MNKYRASIALQLCSYTALMIAAAAAASPSFDCNRARYPDEYAICANSELADLDILVARGYAYLKSTQGAFAADTVGVPFWKARHACGSDLPCIRQREVQAINAYQANGAPIALPDPSSSISSAPVKMQLSPYNPTFIVDGAALGATVNPDSTQYRSMTCRSSQDFSEFTWCSKQRQDTGKFGPQTSFLTVLHSSDNKIEFITQVISPAFFKSDDIDREIARLSLGFGQAQVLVSDPRPGVAHAVLATWGALTLSPLDDVAMDALRRGDEIHRGLIADFLGDSHKSAQVGLPVYHIGGGPGFIWGARFDDTGKGSLQISAADASSIPSPEAPATVQSQPAPAPAVSTPVPVVSAPAPAAPSPGDEARQERARAERLDRVVQAAIKQLDYVAHFIREHSGNPKLLDYLTETATLKAAVEKGDLDDIERRSTVLSADLSRDQGYQQFEAEQEKQQKAVEAQELSDIIRRATAQRAFLVGYSAKNPLASEVATFLPLIKQLDPALDKPGLDQLQRLTGQVDLAIREANLSEAFRTAQTEQPKLSALTPVPQTEVDRKDAGPRDFKLPDTDRNRFLLDGDLADVLLLYNAADAPHVALNLRGQFVFAEDKANACLFGENPKSIALTIRPALAPYNIKAIKGLDQPCDPQKLEAYDILIMQRGAFLKAAQVDTLSLLKQIEKDAIRQFAALSASDIAATSAAERAATEQIASDVAAGARNGFGAILLANGSADFCVVVSDRGEAHDQLILGHAEELTYDMQAAPSLVTKSKDDAFVAVGKKKCGAIYAVASDLKEITEGLARDKIPFTFSTLWITQAAVDGKVAELADRSRSDAKQMLERQQRAEDEKRLRAQRDKDIAATQSAQQTIMRSTYDGPARAAVADIVADITKWEQSESGPAGTEFPEFTAWLAAAKSDHWEIMTTDSAVQDYGLSDFKGRSLDTAFARVSIRMKNSILGEYKDVCFVFGRITDQEFHMLREPTFAHCEDADGVKAWQTGHGFQSRWIVGG